MRISTLARLLEDKLIAAAKASQPHAQRYARSAKHHAAVAAHKAAEVCTKAATKLET